MSSGIATPPSLPPQTPAAPPTEYEVVIDRRLQQTRRHVKGVDITGGFLTLAIGVLAYLLAAAVIDHWLVVGGLGFWGRLVLWLVLVGTAGTYFAGQLWPPLVHRINPIFAAATIEKSQPTLKNSLVNFLLLRGRRQEVAPPVYRAMEYRAAADISRVPIDTAVDRAHVVRLGCVLLGLLAVSILYLVLSPKNPIRSACAGAIAVVVRRGADARDHPRRAAGRQGCLPRRFGRRLGRGGRLAGGRAGPVDLQHGRRPERRSDDPPDAVRGRVSLPVPVSAGQPGLAAGLRILSGRRRLPHPPLPHRSADAPAIVVDKVSYRYPAYTGIADQIVQRQGDLRAIEGTEVTLYATANTPIQPGTAEIDLGCTGRRGVGMTADGATAIGRITLRASAKDATGAEYDSYQLRFTDTSGRPNVRPIRYRIDVIRDLPPEVQLIEPQKEEVQLPENGKLHDRRAGGGPGFCVAARDVAGRARRPEPA